MDIVGERRLLKLSDILDTADAGHKAKRKPTYDQKQITHDCGTPACAMGHWIRSTRGRIVLTSDDVLKHTEAYGSEGVVQVGAVEFRISREQAYELFGGQGCGNARTAKQAARYIRRFVSQVKANEKTLCSRPV